MTKFYLAYGSNCNRDQMKYRCPTAKFIGLADLIDYRLVFRSVADVEPHKGAKVRCAVWRIEARDEAALDHYEGVSSNFYSKVYAELIVKGSKRTALFYVMSGKRHDQFEPPPSYEHACRAGYTQCGIEQGQIDKAIELAANHHKRLMRYNGKWLDKQKGKSVIAKLWGNYPDWYQNAQVNMF